MGLHSNPFIFQYVKWGLLWGQKRDVLYLDEGPSIDEERKFPYTVDELFLLKTGDFYCESVISPENTI
jgi:hypothetical protein